MSNRRRLLSAWGTIREYVHLDPEKPGDLTIETVQDVEPSIKRAKDMSELEPGKDMRHVAVVPHFFYAKAVREGWVNDKAAWRKWANDPANKAFRTWPGRL